MQTQLDCSLTRVGSHRRVGSMKNTDSAAIDAAFIVRNVRAGELIRFSGNPFGRNCRLAPAARQSASPRSTANE